REAFAAVPITLDGTTAAATLTLWALLGLESATVPADKVEDPERTIPRATLAGTIVASLFCAAACSLVLLVVPGSRLAGSNAPFADAARALNYSQPLRLKYQNGVTTLNAISASENG
ncbi:MAG: hypothetical protein HXY24_02190, partial [Rubrivivax sp.]|nr:hypothetical protein [Rubrivivax sp.]